MYNIPENGNLFGRCNRGKLVGGRRAVIFGAFRIGTARLLLAAYRCRVPWYAVCIALPLSIPTKLAWLRLKAFDGRAALLNCPKKARGNCGIFMKIL